MNYFKLTSLAICTVLAVQCTAQKAGKKATEKNIAAKQIPSITKIQLEEMTRESRRMTVITPTSQTTEVNGKSSTKRISAAEWERITKSASSVDLKNLSSHKSPTTKRFYDGAMMSTLSVTSKGTVYQSQTFDSGIPPKAFSDLYFKVAENFSRK